MVAAEKVCRERFKRPEQMGEWLGIKAEMLAWNLNELESACNVQIEAYEQWQKTGLHHAMAMAMVKLHGYEFQLGEFQLAHASALLGYGLCFAKNDPAEGAAQLAAQCMIRSSLALHSYKDALSMAEWLEHKNYVEYKGLKEKRRWNFYGYAQAAALKIECEVKMGYLEDAERDLHALDSIADALNRVAEADYDKVSRMDYAVMPRIRLLIAQNRCDEAMTYIEAYEPDRELDIITYSHLLKAVEFRVLVGDLYRKRGMLERAREEYIAAGDRMLAMNEDHPYMIEINSRMVDCREGAANLVGDVNVLADAFRIVKERDLKKSPYDAMVNQQVLKRVYPQGELKHLWPRWVLWTTVAHYHGLQQEFAVSTFNEQRVRWSQPQYREWFNGLLPQVVCGDKQLAANDTLIGCAYVGVQTAKRLLFNSEHRVRELVRKSNNEELQRKYERLMTLREALLQQYLQPQNGFSNQLKEVYALDNEVMQALPLYEDVDFTTNFRLATKYVKRVKPEEMYFDFVRYRKLSGEWMYAAFMAMNYQGRVGVVPMDVCSEKELQAVMQTGDVYQQGKLYDLLWKRFEFTFHKLGIQRIYFSADGDLHNLAIEHALDAKGQSVSDRYEVYRVTSTKEAILSEKKEKSYRPKHMVALGNMDFNGHRGNSLFAGLDSRLMFSKLEVDEIGRVVPSKTDFQLYEGKVATEEVFKHIDTEHTDLLHVATHGFYWNEDYRKKHREHPYFQRRIFNPQTKGSLSVEDKSMLNSVLLMTKAADPVNASMEGTARSAEDGILSAAEIALMDFKQLDLVVLSAC